MELLIWTPGKHHKQTHYITERHHLNDIEGKGWDGEDLKKYLGWKARDFIDDSSKKNPSQLNQ